LNNNSIHKYNQPSSPNYQPKKDRSAIFMTITVICFFVGFGLSVIFYSLTLISIFDFSKFIAAFAVAGFLILIQFYRKWLHFIKYEVILFNIMGVAPIFSGLFLVINFMFATNTRPHDFKIEKIYFEGDENSKVVGVVLENNEYAGERKIVELTDFNPAEFTGNPIFRVTLSDGFFGYQVINEKKMVK